ncbi:MAG: hypothetical protein ACI4R8_03825 [Candidatus Caccovivens sp.]
MQVLDIIKMVCEFVGEKELRAKLDSIETVTFSAREQEKLDTLVDCFNLVNQEIASDYLPFLTKEEVEGGEIIPFSSLSKAVINIYKVKNRFGLNLKFKLFPDYVQVQGNPKTVVYSYLPQDASINSTVEMYNGLSARVYAYGMASEFLLIDGMSEDAEIWEERFKESLFVLSRKRGEHQMPCRSWF